MNYKFFILILLFTYSCTTTDINKAVKEDVIPSEVYSNKGFTLLFTENLKKKN